MVVAWSGSGCRSNKYPLFFRNKWASAFAVEALLVLPAIDGCFLFLVVVGSDIDEIACLMESEAAAAEGLGAVVPIDDCLVGGWNAADRYLRTGILNTSFKHPAVWTVPAFLAEVCGGDLLLLAFFHRE